MKKKLRRKGNRKYKRILVDDKNGLPRVVYVLKKGRCVFCFEKFGKYGHNPEPLKRYEQRCCDDCNRTKVIPERMRNKNW